MALFRFSEIKKKTVVAIDKKLGKTRDLYFDDIAWKVRYLVVDTWKWLPGKKVLVSPESVKTLVEHAPIPLGLTEAQLAECPDFNEFRPVSREYEMSLNDYYGWKHYWEPQGFLDTRYPFGQYLSFRYGNDLPPRVRHALELRAEIQHPHLRSCKEVMGYRVACTDGTIGNIEDFLIDSSTWEIPFFFASDSSGKIKRPLLVPSALIESVSWPNKEVEIIVPEHLLRTSPEMREDSIKKEMERAALFHYFSYFERPSLTSYSQGSSSSIPLSGLHWM